MIQFKVFGSANFGAKIQILEKVICLARKPECDNFDDAVFVSVNFGAKIQLGQF